MGKELEALERMGCATLEEDLSVRDIYENEYDIVKNALQRLESIDNANPSEALECLNRIDNTLCLNNIKGKLEFGIDDEEHIDCDSAISMTEDLESIKAALLKSQVNARSEELLQKYYQEGITLDSVRELKKENELLKEIIKSLFDRGCPLHQYTDKEGVSTIEVDDECSIMRLGEFKGVDLDKKLKEVLE